MRGSRRARCRRRSAVRCSGSGRGYASRAGAACCARIRSLDRGPADGGPEDPAPVPCSPRKLPQVPPPSASCLWSPPGLCVAVHGLLQHCAFGLPGSRDLWSAFVDSPSRIPPAEGAPGSWRQRLSRDRCTFATAMSPSGLEGDAALQRCQRSHRFVPVAGTVRRLRLSESARASGSGGAGDELRGSRELKLLVRIVEWIAWGASALPESGDCAVFAG